MRAGVLDLIINKGGGSAHKEGVTPGSALGHVMSGSRTFPLRHVWFQDQDPEEAVGHVWFQDFRRTCLRQACMSVRFQDLSVSKVVSKAVSTIKALAL